MSVEKLAAVWPEWKVVEVLGEGSFGKVYKVVRQELSVTTYAAVKVISVPQNESEIASLRSEGMDESAARAYLQGVVNDFINEIKLMESLKGTTNIVSVEDFRVVEKKDSIGWDIFIRMELLKPFNEYIGDRVMTEQEVVRLGVDMCTALELCSRRKIIHRDIKPENIFVSDFGDFKIGDFGIARELEKTSGALSSKGTYNYIAPEVITGRGYDASVDIYSLGLVLYKLMNNNRLPFVDPYATQITYQQRKDAVDRRLSGAPLPAPVNASEALSSVILAACSYKAENRFGTPTAMKKALLSLDTISKTAIIKKQIDSTAAAVNSSAHTPAVTETSVTQTVKAEPAKKSGGKIKLIIILAAILAVAAVAGIAAYTYIYPATKAVEYIGKGDYEAAEKYLVKVSADNSILLDGLNDRLDVIESGFIEGSISYSDVKNELESIASLNIASLSQRLAQLEKDVAALNDTRLIEAIVTAVSQGDYEVALELYAGIQNDDGVLGNELKGHLDKIYTDSAEGILAVADAYAALETIEGMNIQGLSEKISGIKNDLDVLSQSREVFETAKAFDERGNYAKAIEYYRLVNKADPDYSSAVALLEAATENYRNQIFSEAAEYGETADYSGAIDALNRGLIILSEDEAIIDERGKYEALLEEKSIAEATALLEEGEYDKAQAIIEYALELIPESEKLTALLASVDSYRPVSFNAFTVVDSSGYSYKNSEFTDAFGNTHGEAYAFDASYADAYVVYNLDNQYNFISFYLISTPDTSSESSFNVKIFLDDELIEEITDFSKTDTKQLVSFDAKGAEKLEIRVECCDTNYSRIAIVDTQSERNRGE